MLYNYNIPNMSGSSQNTQKSGDNSICEDIDVGSVRSTEYQYSTGLEEHMNQIIEGIIDDRRYTIDDDGNVGIDISDITEWKNEKALTYEYKLIDFLIGKNKTLFGHILGAFVNKFDDISYNNVIYIDKFDDNIPYVEFKNISSDESASGTNLTGDTIRTKVQIQDLASRSMVNLDTVWKCQNSHKTRQEEKRWSNKTEPPAGCHPIHGYDSKDEECRCRPTKRMKNETKTKIDVRRLVLSEIDKDDRNARSLIGDVGKGFINDVSRRDKIEVIANVLTADRKNNTQSEPYLNIIGLQRAGTQVDLSEAKRNKLEDIAEQYDNDDLIEDLTESVAPDILDKDGQYEAKLGVLLSAVRSSGYTKRDMIHTLLYGKKGSGKSDIMEFIYDILPDSQYADTQNASTAGLTATAQRSGKLDNDGDNWIITSGSLPQANGSAVFIDELDKSDIDEKVLGKPMSKGKVIISKAGSATLKSKTSVVATANPDDQQYTDSVSKLESLDVAKHIQDRFDLKIRVDDKIEDRENEKEMLDNISLVDDDNKDDEDVQFSKDELREWVAHAKDKDIKWSTEADELVRDKMLDMRMAFKDVEHPDLEVSNREPRKLQRLCSAMTKLRLGDEVTESDVHRTWDLYVNAWQSVTTNIDIERNYN